MREKGEGRRVEAMREVGKKSRGRRGRGVGDGERDNWGPPVKRADTQRYKDNVFVAD